MQTDLYDYHLPRELIAHYPARIRRKCRMLVLNRGDGSVVHASFEDLPKFLTGGDLVIFNNTRVIPARLLGRKAATGGRVEVFLLRKIARRQWEALVQPSGRCKPGTIVEIDGGEEFTVVVEDFLGPGKRAVRLQCRGPVAAALEKYGHTPLPPYIARPDKKADRRDYQTIFARKPGAVASPTAGLHFDRVILNRLVKAGIKTAEVTLHVGEGSFRPIKAESVEKHKLENEQITVPRRTISHIIRTRRAGRRVIAVGTTVVRTLETVAAWNPRDVDTWDSEAGRPGKTAGESSLFISEPFKFRVIEAMLTNFHLPRSSLLVMVSAFAGRENVLAAYREAVEKNYRFYSYGDCMLIV